MTVRCCLSDWRLWCHVNAHRFMFGPIGFKSGRAKKKTRSVSSGHGRSIIPFLKSTLVCFETSGWRILIHWAFYTNLNTIDKKNNVLSFSTLQDRSLSVSTANEIWVWCQSVSRMFWDVKLDHKWIGLYKAKFDIRMKSDDVMQHRFSVWFSHLLSV